MNRLLYGGIICISLFLSCSSHLFSANIDTINFYSKLLKRNAKFLLITPDSYNSEKDLPVLYLLHAYGVGHLNIHANFPYLEEYADKNEIILVCPNALRKSWYINSEKDKGHAYEDYFINELLPFISSNYSNTDKLGIAGISMGGYGALRFASIHPNYFIYACGISAMIDPRLHYEKFSISELFNSPDEIEYWKDHDLSLLLQNSDSNTSYSLYCGFKDPFYKENVRMCDKLESTHLDLDCKFDEGGHNWDYWQLNLKKAVDEFSRVLKE